MNRSHGRTAQQHMHGRVWQRQITSSPARTAEDEWRAELCAAGYGAVAHAGALVGVIGSTAFWTDGPELRLACLAPGSTQRMTIQLRGAS